MSIRSKRSSSRQQHSQITTNNGLELREDDLVHDGGVVASPRPLESVLVAELYQLTEEWTSLRHLGSDPLEDGLHDQRHDTHNCGLQHRGISQTTLGNTSPSISEGLGAGVTNGNTHDQHQILRQQLENMGQGKHCDVTIIGLDFTEGVRSCGDDAVERLNKIG